VKGETLVDEILTTVLVVCVVGVVYQLQLSCGMRSEVFGSGDDVGGVMRLHGETVCLELVCGRDKDQICNFAFVLYGCEIWPIT